MSTQAISTLSLPEASKGARSLLSILGDGKPRTRAKLAELANVARSTIGLRVDELIALGFATEQTETAYTGGRPSSRIRLEPRARLVLAADIGASHARYAITDLLGNELGSARIELRDGGDPDSVLSWLTGRAQSELAALGRDPGSLGAIGVGLAAPIEHETGRPVKPPIMPAWDAFDVAGSLQSRFDLPVLVEKDVNMMAIGAIVARPRRPRNMIFAKISSGIGAGLVVSGRLYRGDKGTAGDIGHIRVRDSDTPCRCGNKGCLEAIASGPSLVRDLRLRGVDVQSSAGVVRLAGSGDLAAIQAIRQAGRDLGEVLAGCVSLLNPSLIVVGGTLADAGENLLAGVREVVYARAIPVATTDLSIVQAEGSSNAAIRGASALAVHHALALNHPFGG